MKFSGLRRHVLQFCCCGIAHGVRRVESPIGTPGAMPQTSAFTTQAERGGSYKATPPLLYVTNSTVTYDDVKVYRALANDPTPLATISDDVENPTGACIDGQGTLYVTNEPTNGPGWISEYPLGKTAPSKIVRDGVNHHLCAIDEKGNLWVANIFVAMLPNISLARRSRMP